MFKKIGKKIKAYFSKRLKLPSIDIHSGLPADYNHTSMLKTSANNNNTWWKKVKAWFSW